MKCWSLRRELTNPAYAVGILEFVAPFGGINQPAPPLSITVVLCDDLHHLRGLVKNLLVESCPL